MINTKINNSDCVEIEGYKFAYFTAIGNRSEQQDCIGYEFAEQTGVVVISDGMGGHRGGRLASAAAVNKVLELSEGKEYSAVNEEFLEWIADKADEVVYDIRDDQGNHLGAGATLVAVYLAPGEFRYASVGDSRIYLIHEDDISQVTTDQNYELELNEKLRQNEITPEEYEVEMKDKDALISFLGMGGLELVEVSNGSVKVYPGDKILLMTDGLYKNMKPDEMFDIISNFSDVEQALHALDYRAIRNAKIEKKRRDNTSLALIVVK